MRPITLKALHIRTILLLTCVITVLAGGSVMASESTYRTPAGIEPAAVLSSKAVSGVMSAAAEKKAAAKSGWKKEKGKWYYYENGARVKDQWRHMAVKLSDGREVVRWFYFRSKGAACTSVLKYRGKYYVFNKRGMLLYSNSNKLFKVGNYYYCPDQDGVCQTGWIISNGKLYFANKFGRLVHDRTLGGAAGIRFQGIEAVNTPSAQSKLLCMQVIQAVTTPNMTQEQKLYACYRYVVDSCYYVLRGPANLNDPTWMKQKTVEMLSTHGGDCISYACAFAGLAASLGYKSRVIYGRVPGSRDQAPDGFTTHGWVLIDGLQYDPEGEAENWNPNAYATRGYTFAYQVTALYDYTSGQVVGW